MSPLWTALGEMFLQQAFASVGKVLPAVIAPLVITELNADPAWVGVYYGVAAAASLVAQMGCGSFIVRYGALRMSQVAPRCAIDMVSMRVEISGPATISMSLKDQLARAVGLSQCWSREIDMVVTGTKRRVGARQPVQRGMIL